MTPCQASSPIQPARHGTARAANRAPGRALLPPHAWIGLCAALRLSRREMQIVQCVFDDLDESNIAFDLNISRHTVNTYFRRLYNKAGVSNRQQLILRVVAEYLAILDSQDKEVTHQEVI